MQDLYFLDYIAIGKINLNKVKKILQGILNGCKKSNCKLIGGETAEMPGIYDKNKFDLAGFSVGIISKKKLIQKKNVRVGDIILAEIVGYTFKWLLINKKSIKKI